MRSVAVCLVAVAAAASAQDQEALAREFLALERRAFAHFEKGEWQDAIATFERQIATFSRNPRPYYNIACAYALQGDAERSATWLTLAIAHGWRDIDYLAGDTDFDAVRAGDAHQRCVRQLRQIRRQDPDPLPQRLDPASVPAVGTVGTILAASMGHEQVLADSEDLLGEHDYRKRLFNVYDRRVAMLTRYLAENGDAPDADRAALARVETALRYLDAAGDTDTRLRALAVRYADVLAAEFVADYAGSPLLPQVELLRAHAQSRLEPDGAIEALRSVARNHPDGVAAPRARILLCRLLADGGRRDELRAAFDDLERRHGSDEELRGLIRGSLAKARLLAQGLPRVGGVPRAADVSVTVFVAAGHRGSEAALARMRAAGIAPVVACLGDGAEAWLAEHAAGLTAIPDAATVAEAFWVRGVPFVVVTRGDEVLAVNPTGDELAGLLRADG